MTTRIWTKDFLESLVVRSTSIADVIRNSGRNISGGMYRHISGYIKTYDIDISHFTGQGWAKGRTSSTDTRIYTTPDEEVFVRSGTISRNFVRRKFKKLREYQCEICKTEPMWHDSPLTLHMDHINGDNIDHRLENLRWLCPNCHSQTKTYSCSKR